MQPAHLQTCNMYHRIVWPFAIAQTLVWAAMYYAFPALLLAWEQDLGWSKAELSGAFTVGCAVLGAICLLLLSAVTAVWHFYLIWLFLGIAMAGTLYEACFAILTKTMGDQRKRAITTVTLVAGFAGTVSFAGNNALVDLMGWRSTMWVLAAIVIGLAVPLIWVGCRAAETYASPEPQIATNAQTGQVKIAGNLIFWLLALGFSAITLNHSVLLTHLLPLLDEREIANGTAVFAASMIGPMQVAGRVVMLVVEKHISSLMIFAACFIALAIASISLLGATVLPWLLIAFVLLQGAGYGVTSILRPIITADFLGRENFGLIAGFLAVPFMGATAAAPTIAAFIWGVGGYDMVIWFALGTAVFGLGALLGAAQLSRHS